MRAFAYVAPRSVAEAASALCAHPGQARLIAGGQSLLLAMKERTVTPSVLVSLGGVPELRGWHYGESGELVIGATTTYADLVHAVLSGWHAVISAVAGDLADRPVRTMGTIGGALCQADPKFDMPALAAGLDTRLEVTSADGTRTLTVSELYRADGRIALRADEVLTSIRFPELTRFSGAAFEKFRYRVFDAALVSATCAVRLDPEGGVAEARIAVGAVRPSPVLAEDAAQRLIGRPLAVPETEQVAAAVADEICPESSCRTSVERYQRELIAVLVQRALVRALDQATPDRARSQP